MEFLRSEKVNQLLSGYPTHVSNRLYELIAFIEDTANEMGIQKLVETTKWGEPSYLTKKGSTIRLDWKPKTPDHYYLYFICSTELVSTFRIIFGDELNFEDNRAIRLSLDEPIPNSQLKRCLSLALNYHKVKHLHLLGA
ncbi:unnamed protein product [Chrysoparadoxa australica]